MIDPQTYEEEALGSSAGLIMCIIFSAVIVTLMYVTETKIYPQHPFSQEDYL
jgi:hypothetical protein